MVYNFIQILEENHKKDILLLKKDLTIDKLLIMFPEAMEIIPLKFKEARESLKSVAKYIVKAEKEAISRFPTDRHKQEFNFNFISSIIYTESEKEMQNYYRLNSAMNYLRYINSPIKQRSLVKAFDLTIVKNKSFEAILDSIGVNYKILGKRVIINCVFHEDRHPSLSIDLEQKLFHCFGCLEGGDQINFVMKYFKYDFKNACEYLIKI